ncbi:hypothetical protein [Dongia sp.]|uniref:hypothetical protein n=1 Tax=Dongia sp. TaxID=1977262 RepID=UPI0035B13882
MRAVNPGQATKSGATVTIWAKQAWPWLLLLLLSLGFGVYVRYGLIQSTPIGLMCQASEPAWFCGPRHLLWQIGNMNGWGWGAMIGGMLAILFGWRAAIVLAIVAGGAGLALYNAGPAAFGLLLALMRLVRR